MSIRRCINIQDLCINIQSRGVSYPLFFCNKICYKIITKIEICYKNEKSLLQKLGSVTIIFNFCNTFCNKNDYYLKSSKYLIWYSYLLFFSYLLKKSLKKTSVTELQKFRGSAEKIFFGTNYTEMIKIV